MAGATWPSAAASALLSQKLGRRRWADVPLFHGERMRVLVGETVSRAILGFGFSEPDLTALLCELLPTGATAVDIGTHFGYEAILMANLTGPQGLVHAFEPNPAVAAGARHNLSRHTHVTLHECALGRRCARARFAFPPLERSSFGGFSCRETGTTDADVEIRTLDEAGLPSEVSLIKFDAEGH